MPANSKVHYNYIFNSSTQSWVPDTGGGSGGGTTESLHKSSGVVLQLCTTVSGASVLRSSEVDVTPYKSIMLFIDHGPISTTAPSVGTEYRVQVNATASDAEGWRTLQALRTVATGAVTGTCEANMIFPAKTKQFFFIRDELDNLEVSDREFLSQNEAVREFNAPNIGPERIGVLCTVLREKVQVLTET